MVFSNHNYKSIRLIDMQSDFTDFLKKLPRMAP
jgi:hypothetical protein